MRITRAKTLSALVGALLLSVNPVSAEPQPAVKPAARVTFEARAEPDAIALYGKDTPGTASSENWLCLPNGDCSIRNVTRPTLTAVRPKAGTANGAAVLVLPGGGFMSLALDHEGYRIARALADRGITAFVLKYRLKPTPADDREAQAYIGKQMAAAFGTAAGPESLFNPDALADAQAALALVRRDAKTWDIDPARTGMIGFSAGARTTLRLVLDSPAAERPAFFGYIYGDMASKPVPEGAPPMFAAIAFNDALYRKGNVALAQDWFAAKRPVELHVYQKGGHGFGPGLPGTTSTQMLDQFTAWLAMQGFLKPAKAN